MKTAIIISGDIKQIMFTPENDSEKQAIKMITADDDISVEFKQGSFHDDRVLVGYTVGMCKGGYLRAWDNDNSLMLVLKPKKDEKEN
jgi:hypothetical protein